MKNSVLVLDDDVNARIIAETLLRGRGLHVLSAGNGAEACDVVRCEGAAVVVLALPKCDAGNLEMLRILRDQFESFPVPTPRIVVVAGSCEPEVECNALRSSADVFLRKPLEPAQFIAIVERLIATNAFAQSKSESGKAVIGFATEDGPALGAGSEGVATTVAEGV